MSRQLSLLSLVALLTSALFAGFLMPTNIAERNVRFVNDYSDRAIYAERGSWWRLGKRPYIDVFSEYPQVATYVFAAPDVTLSLLTRNHQATLREYSFLFSLLMLAFSWRVIILIYESRRERKSLAFLLLLPASWYFTYNRFDILPAYLCLLGLIAGKSQHYGRAGFWLASAVLTKWFAVLLVPIVMADLRTNAPHKMRSFLLTFGITALVILLPTWIDGGLAGLWIPYRFHLSRGMNTLSLPFLVNDVGTRLLHVDLISPAILSACFVAQFLPALVAATDSMNSFDRTVKWSVVSIAVFVVFAKFQSPQWILWISPLFLLVARTRLEIAWLICFDLVTYLQFPILFDTVKRFSPWLEVVSSLRNLMLIAIAVILGCELLREHPMVQSFARHRKGSIAG